MPCSDSSSGLNIILDAQERIIKFEFAKITCSREISAATGLSAFCRGKPLGEILALDFHSLRAEFGIAQDEEAQFILYLELEALKSGIAQYLGVEHPSLDSDRCRVTAIEYSPEGVEISLVILPPKEMPKILPCSLARS